MSEAEAKAAKKYRVNEIFYSVQAEGANAGRPAVFVRLSGCNLKCPFCDTDHEPFREMTKAEIEAEVDSLAPMTAMVVITGGEPTIQLTNMEPMFKSRFVAIETNGINQPPWWIDWITVSPKTRLPAENLAEASELKFLYGQFPDEYLLEVAEWANANKIPCYIQPTADKLGNFNALPAIDFAKAHPYWKLSLQFHKLIDIR
jgi:organic radical activating enzyme